MAAILDPRAVARFRRNRGARVGLILVILAVAAALFAGAAFYISFAEQPARLGLDDGAALDDEVVWQRRAPRGDWLCFATIIGTERKGGKGHLILFRDLCPRGMPSRRTCCKNEARESTSLKRTAQARQEPGRPA